MAIPFAGYLSNVLSRGGKKDKEISEYIAAHNLTGLIDECTRTSEKSDPRNTRYQLTSELMGLQKETGATPQEINRYLDKKTSVCRLAKYEYNPNAVTSTTSIAKPPGVDESLTQDYKDKLSLGARGGSALLAELNKDGKEKVYLSEAAGSSSPLEPSHDGGAHSDLEKPSDIGPSTSSKAAPLIRTANEEAQRLGQSAAAAASSFGSRAYNSASAGGGYLKEKAPIVVDHLKGLLGEEEVDPQQVQDFQNYLVSRNFVNLLDDFKKPKGENENEKVESEKAMLKSIKSTLDDYKHNKGIDTEEMVRLNRASGITDKLEKAGCLVAGGWKNDPYKRWTVIGGEIENRFENKYGSRIKELLGELSKLPTETRKEETARQISKLAEQFREESNEGDFKNFDARQMYLLLNNIYPEEIASAGLKIVNPEDNPRLPDETYVVLDRDSRPSGFEQYSRVVETISREHKLPERKEAAIKLAKTAASTAQAGTESIQESRARGEPWYSGLGRAFKGGGKKEKDPDIAALEELLKKGPKNK